MGLLSPSPSTERGSGGEVFLRLAWIGWTAVGIASLFALLLQASLAAGTSMMDTASLSAVGGLLTGSTYGGLWLLRMALWAAFGAALAFTRRDSRALWLALIPGALMLLVHSAFSHGAATQIATAAIVGDWLHLLVTTFWVGGLVAFAVAIPAAHRAQTHDTPRTVGRLVGYFSNYARVAVAALVVTGLYASWLHVGSVDALLTTTYGRALLIKLGLFTPLLLTAAVNLFITHRRLESGQTLWVGRFRLLVLTEIILMVGILAMAGVLTSGVPARGVVAVREAVVPETELPSYFEMQIVNDQMIHFEVEPGYVGENTFTIQAADDEGQLITDASLIRLRFTNLDQDMGQSELRIEPEGPSEDGYYSVSGANLSTPGRWRVRMTVQRPGKFDMVTDFEVDAKLPPAPPAPVVDVSIPVRQRLVNTLAAGLALLAIGFFFAAPAPQHKTSPAPSMGKGVRRRVTGQTALAAAAMIAGLALAATAGLGYLEQNQPQGTVSARGAYAFPALRGSTGGVYLTIENSTRQPDRLIGATTEKAASVELHSTTFEGDVARMEQLPFVDIPAGSTFTFESGAHHVMLVALHADLNPGDTFVLKLQFASGKEVPVVVTVR